MTLSFEADCVLVKRSPTGARQATGSGAGRVVRDSCGAPYKVTIAEAGAVDAEEEASQVLRRFYRCAEEVLFPDAIIDKLIGDEVMALYLPELWRDYKREETPALMLEHARQLLCAVGYAGEGAPFVQMGVGIDFGEAFVGNIGQRALYDFTAVGDVVNT